MAGNATGELFTNRVAPLPSSDTRGKTEKICINIYIATIYIYVYTHTVFMYTYNHIFIYIYV